MQASFYSPEISYNRPFNLIPCEAKEGMGRVGIFGKAVVLPLLLTGICLYYFLELQLSHWLIAMTLALLVLLNTYFFFLFIRNASGTMSLQIDLDEIRLIQDHRILYRESLKNIRVDQLSWGKEVSDPLPVIRIEGAHFPKIYISSGVDLPNFRQVLKSLNCRVASETEWLRLMQALGGFR